MLDTELSVFISKFSFLIKDRKQSQNISISASDSYTRFPSQKAVVPFKFI